MASTLQPVLLATQSRHLCCQRLNRHYYSGKDVLDPDHESDAVTVAVHDRMPVILDPIRLRRLARSGNAECGCCVRTLEAIRCPADAVLSRKYTNQQCGE